MKYIVDDMYCSNSKQSTTYTSLHYVHLLLQGLACESFTYVGLLLLKIVPLSVNIASQQYNPFIPLLFSVVIYFILLTHHLLIIIYTYFIILVKALKHIKLNKHFFPLFNCIFSITIYPPYTHSHPNQHIMVCVHESFFLFAQSLHPQLPLPPTQTCQPALHLWVCLYFACQFSLFVRFHI